MTKVHERDLIVGLQKGLKMIQLFNRDTPRLTVPDIAQKMSLTPSAARRFLLTLYHEGFIEREGRDYKLTPKVLRLGQAYIDSAQLPNMLRPIVDMISRTTHEHASASLLDGDEVIHIVRSRYSHISSSSIRTGARMPLYCTASGRVWLAWLGEEARESYLARVPLTALTPYTCINAAELRQSLITITNRGYAMVDQEYEVGMRVLAIPVFNREKRIKATLSITTHVSRESDERLLERCLTPLYEAQSILRGAI